MTICRNTTLPSRSAIDGTPEINYVLFWHNRNLLCGARRIAAFGMFAHESCSGIAGVSDTLPHSPMQSYVHRKCAQGITHCSQRCSLSNLSRQFAIYSIKYEITFPFCIILLSHRRQISEVKAAFYSYRFWIHLCMLLFVHPLVWHPNISQEHTGLKYFNYGFN